MLELLKDYYILKSLCRLALALLCGGLLGIERGRKKRPAGFRTYMLVCMGSALVMMTNEYINDVYGTGDVARMGAQVIDGIGFLINDLSPALLVNLRLPKKQSHSEVLTTLSSLDGVLFLEEL